MIYQKIMNIKELQKVFGGMYLRGRGDLMMYYLFWKI